MPDVREEVPRFAKDVRLQRILREAIPGQLMALQVGSVGGHLDAPVEARCRRRTSRGRRTSDFGRHFREHPTNLTKK
jgi:hypothetical protein